MIDTHAEAHKLHRAKLSITLCPPGSKKPFGEGWLDAKRPGKAWQKKRWTLKEIDRAFKIHGELNVGVLLGPRSGLIDIEEDSPEGANTFAELFKSCAPPVTASFRSKRGPHRLFAWHPDLERIGKAHFEFRGLEVKVGANGKGTHSAFPPSVTNGVAREWLIPLDECPAAPLPDRVRKRLIELGTNGFWGKMGEKDGKTVEEHREHKLLPVSTVSSVSHNPNSPSPTAAIQQAIAATIPNMGGQRYGCIFKFARHLKAIPSLVDADENTLRPYVEWWHETALPVITTKPFEETWFDFRNAWRSVKFPVGRDRIASLFEQALAGSPPACTEQYQQPELRALISLCRELQRVAGEEPFFLDCRTAGRLLAVRHTQAWRWLKMLCMDGVLVLVERGKRHQANEYRYLGD